MIIFFHLDILLLDNYCTIPVQTQEPNFLLFVKKYRYEPRLFLPAFFEVENDNQCTYLAKIIHMHLTIPILDIRLGQNLSIHTRT